MLLLRKQTTITSQQLFKGNIKKDFVDLISLKLEIRQEDF